MEAVKPVYLLLICQGFYLGSVGQSWTVPEELSALIGSCLEIPCTYDPWTLGPSSTVWFSHYSGYRQILNTEDSSSVLEEYRGRTSIVPGNNSCTLRIDPVRKEDGGEYYFPGITGYKSINSYEKRGRSVYLYVTETAYLPLQISETMTEGEATTIRCYVDHTCRSTPPTIKWNKPGKVTQKSVENHLGYWTEESELTYIPTYVDDGSDIKCMATYHNEIKTKHSIKLNIMYSPKNVTVTAIGINEVIEGSDVTLQCNSVSNPKPFKYEWYKGKDKTKLPYTGRKITVHNVTLNMEPYSCAAINRMGRGESALMDIPVLWESMNLPLILGSVAGVFVLLFYILVVYFFLRTQRRKKKVNMEIFRTITKPNRFPLHRGLPSMWKPMQPLDEVEYSVISHRRQDQEPLTSARASHAEEVEYATLRH